MALAEADLVGPVLATAADYAERQVRPNAAAWEAERRMPADLLRRAARDGLGGLLVPREFGGAGLGASALGHVAETLAGACMAFTFSLIVHNNLAGNIARNGGPAQRERHLPRLLRGEAIGAFLLTEPGSGSDAANLATLARRDGAGWRLEGEKAWVTNAAACDLLSVYAQTDAEAGARGIACFLIEADADGVTRLPAYHQFGGHALGTGGFRFDGCAVPADALFIPPGKAFHAAMAGIDLARALVGAMCCGIIADGLATALGYTGARTAFGRPLADFQGLQWMLADVATDLEATRLLTEAALAAIDDDRPATIAAAHAKKFAARAAVRGLSACMQAMGAAGLSHEHALARHLANAKICEFIDGTTEIQNVVIARHLWADRREGGES